MESPLTPLPPNLQHIPPQTLNYMMHRSSSRRRHSRHHHHRHHRHHGYPYDASYLHPGRMPHRAFSNRGYSEAGSYLSGGAQLSPPPSPPDSLSGASSYSRIERLSTPRWRGQDLDAEQAAAARASFDARSRRSMSPGHMSRDPRDIRDQFYDNGDVLDGGARGVSRRLGGAGQTPGLTFNVTRVFSVRHQTPPNPSEAWVKVMDDTTGESLVTVHGRLGDEVELFDINGDKLVRLNGQDFPSRRRFQDFSDLVVWVKNDYDQPILTAALPSSQYLQGDSGYGDPYGYRRQMRRRSRSRSRSRSGEPGVRPMRDSLDLRDGRDALRSNGPRIRDSMDLRRGRSLGGYEEGMGTYGTGYTDRFRGYGGMGRYGNGIGQYGAGMGRYVGAVGLYGNGFGRYPGGVGMYGPGYDGYAPGMGTYMDPVGAGLYGAGMYGAGNVAFDDGLDTQNFGNRQVGRMGGRRSFRERLNARARSRSRGRSLSRTRSRSRSRTPGPGRFGPQFMRPEQPEQRRFGFRRRFDDEAYSDSELDNYGREWGGMGATNGSFGYPGARVMTGAQSAVEDIWQQSRGLRVQNFGNYTNGRRQFTSGGQIDPDYFHRVHHYNSPHVDSPYSDMLTSRRHASYGRMGGGTGAAGMTRSRSMGDIPQYIGQGQGWGGSYGGHGGYGGYGGYGQYGGQELPVMDFFEGERQGRRKGIPLFRMVQKNGMKESFVSADGEEIASLTYFQGMQGQGSYGTEGAYNLTLYPDVDLALIVAAIIARLWFVDAARQEQVQGVGYGGAGGAGGHASSGGYGGYGGGQYGAGGYGGYGGGQYGGAAYGGNIGNPTGAGTYAPGSTGSY